MTGHFGSVPYFCHAAQDRSEPRRRLWPRLRAPRQIKGMMRSSSERAFSVMASTGMRSPDELSKLIGPNRAVIYVLIGLHQDPAASAAHCRNRHR
jgi:hypothetical protein